MTVHLDALLQYFSYALEDFLSSDSMWKKGSKTLLHSFAISFFGNSLESNIQIRQTVDLLRAQILGLLPIEKPPQLRFGKYEPVKVVVQVRYMYHHLRARTGSGGIFLPS